MKGWKHGLKSYLITILRGKAGDPDHLSPL